MAEQTIKIAKQETLEEVNNKVDATAKETTAQSILSSIGSGGSGGGSNSITVQRGVITIAASENSETATISSVETGKSFVVFGGSRYGLNTTGASAYWDATLELTNATTVTATRAATPSYTAIVPYQVVTFS